MMKLSLQFETIFQYIYMNLRAVLFWVQGCPTCLEPLDWLQLRQCCPVVQIQLHNSYVSWQEWYLILLKHDAQYSQCVHVPSWQYTVHILKQHKKPRELMLVRMDSCTCSQQPCSFTIQHTKSHSHVACLETPHTSTAELHLSLCH